MSAKNVLIISSQSFLSTLETTSSSQSESASIISSSSSSTRDKRAIKHSLSLSNDLSEIDRTSLDIAELVELSRDIDSSNLKVSNIVEEKRVRKPKKTANLAVAPSLDIGTVASKMKDIDTVASKIKDIYSTFAVTTRLTRLHRDSLPPPPKLWRGTLRHPHAEGFQKAAFKFAEHLSNLGPEHLHAANHCLQYRYGTKYLAIKYSLSRGGELTIRSLDDHDHDHDQTLSTRSKHVFENTIDVSFANSLE
jgi:hypothetical protein